ncbi:hypothetical protein PMAYCL1PPCAC_17737, partial [Pristionchus mayeri]
VLKNARCSGCDRLMAESDSDDLDEDFLEEIDEEDEEEELRLLEGEDEEESRPIEEDDPSLPEYDTVNRHSYLYHDTGPVSFSCKVLFPLDDGHDLKEVHTTFHSFPLNIGDEVPYMKLDENDNRVIRMVIQQESHLLSINCGDADHYEVANLLRDRSRANDTSIFPLIDAVALEVISHATKEENGSEKTVAVCRVVGRVRLERLEKYLTGLIYSWGVVVAPQTLPSYELAALSRAELALSQINRGASLQHLLAFNSRLIMQCTTSISIDRLCSVMTWIPAGVLDKLKKKSQWRVVTFLMRALPLDRRLHNILIKENCTDAQISILNSIDYSTLHGFCITCQHQLFTVSDLVYLKPWLSSAVFVNPAEYMFDTLIVRHTVSPSFGALDESFSWFSGYGWSFIRCWDQCRTHLGWTFESKTLRPSKFAALKRDRFRVMSEEIKLILQQYDRNDIHPNRFFRSQILLSLQQ